MSAVLTPPTQGYRIDHQGYAPEVWAGIFLTAIYLLQTDRVIRNIQDPFETLLDAAIAVGSGLCLLGALIGTRYLFPHARPRVSYTLQMIGLPIIIAVLACYAYAATDASTSVMMVVLGGGFGLCIEIASVRMLIELITATREEP